jgi:Zn-dependent alcohol dehydrogenase
VHRSFELIRSGVIDTEALISEEQPLEAVEESLLRMIRGEVVKISINPQFPEG